MNMYSSRTQKQNQDLEVILKEKKHIQKTWIKNCNDIKRYHQT